jgi:hypothetical protein
MNQIGFELRYFEKSGMLASNATTEEKSTTWPLNACYVTSRSTCINIRRLAFSPSNGPKAKSDNAQYNSTLPMAVIIKEW